MITLSKINVSDKVSAWINCVNNIIDTIKLAVAPTTNDDGELVGGNDGYMSKEDKKKLDELDLIFMPISGNIGNTSTWKNVKELSDSSFFVTIESPDVVLVSTNGTCTVDVVAANVDEYSEKTLYFIPSGETNLTITGISDPITFGGSGEKKLVKVVFIGGDVFTSIINS